MKMIRPYSQQIGRLLDNPDPVYGKQLQIMSLPGRERTVEGVTAMLNAMYPPQLMPAPELYHEVYDICREYSMDLLIERLKLGITKQCDVSHLEAVQDVLRKPVQPPETLASIMPHVVFDAFAEFAVDELKALPGYEGLLPRTKLEIAQRRVAKLERHLAKHFQHRQVSHPELFRKCPADLVQDVAHDSGKWSPQSLGYHDGFARAAVSSPGSPFLPWPPWAGGAVHHPPDAASSPARRSAARRPMSAGSVSSGGGGRGGGSPAAGAWRPDSRR